MNIWSKIYSKIGWMNKPSTQTPINDANLNKMDDAINVLDDRVIELNVIKADTSTVNQSLKDFTIDEETGTITVTWQNGTIKTYDTNIEKIAVNFRYDPTTQKLILTLIDETTVEVDLSALVTQYEFLDSNTVVFEISASGEVSATIKKGSITDDMLENNYLAKVTLQATNAQSNAQQAQQSANNADYDAKLAQSYSVGGSGIRENEDTDNSKYYKEECQKALSQMQDVQVTGVKGENETAYRKGDVNITAENLGLGSVKTDIVKLKTDLDLLTSEFDITKLYKTSSYGDDYFNSFDVNNWTEAGSYEVKSKEMGSLNLPDDTDGWGAMHIFTNNGNGILQMYSPTNGQKRLFYRTHTLNYGWSAWQWIITDTDVSTLRVDFASNAGGTDYIKIRSNDWSYFHDGWIRAYYIPNENTINMDADITIDGESGKYPAIRVRRAWQDGNGNDIVNTYMPKSNIRTASGATHTNYGSNGGNVPTMDFLSFWNGAHDANGNSNLRRCAYGEIIGSNNIGNYAKSKVDVSFYVEEKHDSLKQIHILQNVNLLNKMVSVTWWSEADVVSKYIGSLSTMQFLANEFGVFVRYIDMPAGTYYANIYYL